jgi:hypothetical protein
MYSEKVITEGVFILTRGITAGDIKWASWTKIEAEPKQTFLRSLCLFVCEVIRSDEIGLIVWQHQQILMVKVEKINFDTEMHYAEIINFESSRLVNMLETLNFESNKPTVGLSGFEVFCYRPKVDKSYHPKMHPTYLRARERASRIIDAIYAFGIDSEPENGFVAFAQVDKKISERFLKKFTQQTSNEKKFDGFSNFIETVDVWMREFYTDKVGSKNYKTKNRYPIAPQPIEGAQLFVLTTDDDGNPISYETKT